MRQTGTNPIWEAIGQALMQLGPSLGNLRAEDENKKRYREEQEFRQGKETFDRQMTTSADARAGREEAGRNQDRQRSIIQNAIESLDPNAPVSDKLYNDSKEFGLEGRFQKHPQGEVAGVNSGLGWGMGMPMPQLQDSITRKPTFAEDNLIKDRQRKEDDADKANIFKTRLASPEFGSQPYDTQVREALSHGVELPMLSGEWNRRQGVEHKNRLGEISAQTNWHSNVPGKTPEERYALMKDRFMDDTRQKYAPELSSLSKAVADGINVEQNQLALQALYGKIDSEAEAQTIKVLGAMPDKTPKPQGPMGPEMDATQRLISEIPTAVGKFNGDYNAIKRFAAEHQEELRKDGVDVQTYINAIGHAGRQAHPQAPKVIRSEGQMPQQQSQPTSQSTNPGALNSIIKWFADQQKRNASQGSPF